MAVEVHFIQMHVAVFLMIMTLKVMNITNLTLQALVTDMVNIQKLTHFMKVVCSASSISEAPCKGNGITLGLTSYGAGNSGGLICNDTPLSNPFYIIDYGRTGSWHMTAYAGAGRDLGFDASLCSDVYKDGVTEVTPLYESTLICISY